MRGANFQTCRGEEGEGDGRGGFPTLRGLKISVLNSFEFSLSSVCEELRLVHFTIIKRLLIFFTVIQRPPPLLLLIF
jgi:hypothetical protein